MWADLAFEDGGRPGSELASVPLDRPGLAHLRFGDYVLEKELAHGGMGVIYRARQISLDRPVALKLLLLGRYASAESIEQFRHEAQSAAALHHPHIVAIYEAGEFDAQPFISMELVEGRSLAEILRNGPLPPGCAAQYTRDIARTIQYAHDQGVLHRDLKPSNVLLDTLGQVRVTDFGLAKRLGSTDDLTRTAQLIGSPNYLSPEQAAGRQSEVGTGADIYAIGALLYDSLTGRPPFLSPSLCETLAKLRDEEPVLPRALNPAVPRDLETICLKCLSKSISGRYGSAKLLAEDLNRFLEGRPIVARPVISLARMAR